MLKWNAALDSAALLSRELLEEMWTPVVLNDGTTRPYGFGLPAALPTAMSRTGMWAIAPPFFEYALLPASEGIFLILLLFAGILACLLPPAHAQVGWRRCWRTRGNIWSCPTAPCTTGIFSPRLHARSSAAGAIFEILLQPHRPAVRQLEDRAREGESRRHFRVY